MTPFEQKVKADNLTLEQIIEALRDSRCVDSRVFPAIILSESGEEFISSYQVKALLDQANIQREMTKDDWQALPEIMKFVNRQGIEDWYGKGAIKQLKKIEKKLNKIADSIG